MAKHDTPFIEYTVRIFRPLTDEEWHEYKESPDYQAHLLKYLENRKRKQNGGKPNASK